MEDIARSLRRAEMHKQQQPSSSTSSRAGKLLVATLVLVAGMGALVTVGPLRNEPSCEPLRELLAKVPLVDKYLLATDVEDVVDERTAGAHHHHHRLGAGGGGIHGNDSASTTRCEMNGRGDCVMVASVAAPKLTEEEVQLLMEDEQQVNNDAVNNSTSTTETSTAASTTSAANKASEPAATTKAVSVLELRRAAAVGDEDTVSQCLSTNPEWVNDSDRNQWTPLHLAVRAGHVSVVRVLLKFGADVRAKTVTNESPMDMATKRLGADHPVTQLLQSHAVWLLSQSMHRQQQQQQHASSSSS